MRNLNEEVVFCFECSEEIANEGHHIGHTLQRMRLNQVPWNMRRDWIEERFNMQEQSPFYWDEE